MRRLGHFVGWLPLGLMLPLVVLDAVKYEGFRPERSDVDGAGAVVAVLACLTLGIAYGRVVAGRRLLLPLAGAVGSAGLYLWLSDQLFRQVVPVEGTAGRWWPGLAAATVAAAAGLVAGRVWGRPWSAGYGRRWYVVAAAVLLLGFVTVPSFVAVGLEVATTRFLPPDAVTVQPGRPASVPLPAGRHGVFGTYGDDAGLCTIGDGLAVRPPAVPFTDRSDSIQAVLTGTIEIDRAGVVPVDCRAVAQIGGLPVIDSPLEPLLYASPALIWVAAALPGLVMVVAGVLAGTRRERRPGRRPPAGRVSRRPPRAPADSGETPG